MDQAKTALDNMGEKGLEEVQKRVQGVLAGGDKAGAEGAAGGAGGANPIAGLDVDKAKAALDSMGEKGVADAKAALEKGDIKGAVEGALGSMGGDAKK